MKAETVEAPKERNRWIYALYVLTLVMITLSGFAQMPIFKRYYIADLPGLGWLARYYVTHLIHYLSAAVLIGIVSNRITRYLVEDRHRLSLTPSGYLRGSLLLGLIFSGALLTIRNLRANPFPPETIVYLDLAHILFMVLFLFTLLFCALFKNKWTKSGF